MTAIFVDGRVGVLVVAAALLVVWALVDPAGLQGTIDQILAAVTGAIDGAKGAM